MSVAFYPAFAFLLDSFLRGDRSACVSTPYECTYVEKRNECKRDCIGSSAVAAPFRLRGVRRPSFDVKHVRHEEYVNNANKTLFIARPRARAQRAWLILSLFFMQFIYPVYSGGFLSSSPPISPSPSSPCIKARCIALGPRGVGVNTSGRVWLRADI